LYVDSSCCLPYIIVMKNAERKGKASKWKPEKPT
jgi:hypothetical protein